MEVRQVKVYVETEAGRFPEDPELVVERDRYGRGLYPGTVAKVKRVAGRLCDAGYRESRRKPGLFYRDAWGCVWFADLRGSNVVPIWDDQRPLFYWSWKDGPQEKPGWMRRRHAKDELERLFAEGVECRLSFYFPQDIDEFQEDWILPDFTDGVCNWTDGRCDVCGKDFGGEGNCCSGECEREGERAFHEWEAGIMKRLWDPCGQPRV